MKEKYPNEEFAAFRGWATMFLRCHNLALRMKTLLAQRLPADLEERITNFHRMVYSSRLNDDFELELVGNMDGTPAYFDIIPGCTIDAKGQKRASFALLAV